MGDAWPGLGGTAIDPHGFDLQPDVARNAHPAFVPSSTTYEVRIGEHAVLSALPVSYQRTLGPRPSLIAFRLPRASLDEIKAEAGYEKPYDLTVKTPGPVAPEHTIANLWYVDESPVEQAEAVGIGVFADRRVWWPYRTIDRCYNLHRQVGVKRPVYDAAGQFATLPTSADIQWRRASLKIDNGSYRPWSMREILHDVVTAVDPSATIVDDESFVALDEPQVDEIYLRGDGASAIQQALEYFPEATMTVDPNGNVVFYSRAAGLEHDEELSDRIGPHIEGSSALVRKDLRATCPTSIRVYFPILCEVRFDAIDWGERSTFADIHPRMLTNVIPLPEWDRVIGGQRQVQGTYVPFDDYLDSLPLAPGGVQVTREMVRVAQLPGLDLMGTLGELGRFAETENNWPAIAAGLARHFRRTFVLPAPFADNSLAIEAQRITVLNHITAQRAPSPVYSEHCIVPTDKGKIRRMDELDADGMHLLTNVNGYAPTLDERAFPAEATVLVGDQDKGVIDITYVSDPYGLGAMLLPSMVEIAGLPMLSDRRRGRYVAAMTNTVTQSGTSNALPKLTDDHRLSTILTLTPGLPNTERRHYAIDVNVGDVVEQLPAAVQAIVWEARGITQELFEGRESARIAWSDQASATIESIFLSPTHDDAALRPLVVNDDQFQPLEAPAQRGANIRALAHARAIREWSRYAEHLSGSLRGGHAHATWGLPLRGWAESITTTLSEDGTTHTTVTFPDRLPLLDWATLLGADQRQIIFRQVWRRGGA